jgi:hypothetical protein
MGDAGSRRVKEQFTAMRFDAELGSLLQIILSAERSGRS